MLRYTEMNAFCVSSTINPGLLCHATALIYRLKRADGSLMTRFGDENAHNNSEITLFINHKRPHVLILWLFSHVISVFIHRFGDIS